MLPERERELLTAYVDGELSARQRRALKKLLRRSPEARELLRRMQADSQELRALRPAPLKQDLSDSVLMLISQRQIQPPRPRVAPPSTVSLLFWPYVAAAAAILLAVGFGSYLFFAFSFEQGKPTSPVAKEANKPTPTPERPKKPVDSPKAIVDKTPAKHDDKTPSKPEDKPQRTPDPLVKDKPETPKSIEDPKTPDEPLTAPNLELFELKKVDVAPPLVVKLHQLDQEGKRKALLGELHKTASLRLELPCGNGSKAFAHLQAASKAENIRLLIERSAQERLKKPMFKTNYVVYLEDVTPEELVRWLERAVAEDKKTEPKKPRDPQLEALVVTQMTKQDREQLSKLLASIR